MLIEFGIAAGLSVAVSTVRVSTLMMSVHFRMMSMANALHIALIFSVAVAAALAYEHEDYHSHPSYKFEYGVKDPHTGDHKSQWEHRDGDVVKGSYTLEEADGTHLYGHHEGGHSYGGHGHGKASSYANGNLYQHHH
uniref:Uncharacterized protein n=1 Tax=Anopheles albimanus TaxID=7167 RepID=A0A182FFN4_ANOAL